MYGFFCFDNNWVNFLQCIVQIEGEQFNYCVFWFVGGFGYIYWLGVENLGGYKFGWWKCWRGLVIFVCCVDYCWILEYDW